MVVKVEITPKAFEQAQELSEPIYSRVMTIIDRWQHWPAVSGAKPLPHARAGHYRVRTGDYRIQFRLRGDTIIVEQIAHRDGFYED